MLLLTITAMAVPLSGDVLYGSFAIFQTVLPLARYFCKQPARVSAHNVEMEKGQRDKTVFLIKFDPEVMLREARLG